MVALQEALRLAREANLDLVEVSPGTEPPVCRVLNLGKFLYEKEKKDRLARKAQTKIEVKEIRLRPKTTDHHRSFKMRDARKWLLDGMKVKVRIRFRGREITYPEIAREDLAQIAKELEDMARGGTAPGYGRAHDADGASARRRRNSAHRILHGSKPARRLARRR